MLLTEWSAASAAKAFSVAANTYAWIYAVFKLAREALQHGLA